jgi:hypothetical protein
MRIQPDRIAVALAVALVVGGVVLQVPPGRGALQDADTAICPVESTVAASSDVRSGLSIEDHAVASTDWASQFGDVENGSTSGGVSVGVIDATFDPGHPTLTGQVAGHRRFGSVSGGIGHGTAVAGVVGNTLPSSDLYLASIGETTTGDDYRRAVSWLLANDVDVIVDAGSYFPRSVPAARPMRGATERAVDAGVVFVTSAGNYRRQHWAGTGTTEGWVEFEENVQANTLANGERFAGRVSLRLSWNSSADYDLYLYRYRPGGDHAVVAKSIERERGTGGAIEAIDASVPRGRYFVAAYARDGAPEAGSVELFAAHRRLEYSSPNGSVVASSSVEGVIVVGAYARSNGSVAPYSSRGGVTAEVDLVAPERATVVRLGTLRGTSAAVPYVAGTAAAIKSRNRTISPVGVERILESTANHGRLDPDEAVVTAGSGGNVSVAGP